MAKISMAKSKILILVSLFLIFLLANFIFAQIELKRPPKEYEKTPLEIRYPHIGGLELVETPSLPEYIRYIYYFSIIIAGLIAFASLVYGGFRYLTSVGQPVAMAMAREQITAGFVGLVILLGSYLLLSIINPQLTIFRLVKPPSPELEIPEVKPWGVTTEKVTFYEIPIGQAIERVLEPKRLEAIRNLAENIGGTSKDLKEFSQDYSSKIQECNQCRNTSPSPSSCNPDNTCPAEDDLQCSGDPCKDRKGANEAKVKLKEKAEEMTPLVNKSLLYLVPLQQDNKMLQFASNVFLETLVPLGYSQYLAYRQMAATVGGTVERAPFIFEGVRLLPAGDFATFYTPEEQIGEILAQMGSVFYTPYRTTATCDQCEIDLNATDITIPESLKEEVAQTYPEIKDQCPESLDCWDYVIKKAKENNINPVFVLALWGEESGFSADATCIKEGQPVACAVLGCDPRGELGYTGDLVSQLECFIKTFENQQADGMCKQETTEFCAFMKRYSGGSTCVLTGAHNENPTFWVKFFNTYTSLLSPSFGPGGNNAAMPSGDCTLQPEKLPAELAGCPLQPGTFTYNETGWHYYCEPGYAHDGMDIYVPDNTPVYAVTEGTARGLIDSYGAYYVALETGYGLFTYVHLRADSHARAGIPPKGKRVSKGELIGFVGCTGICNSPHLHFSFYPGGVYKPEEAEPIECLGIQCIPDTTASNLCTDGRIRCQ